jgi:multiple sugar transport system permease protein
MFFVTYYYEQAFQDLHLGYASAMAFLLFVIVVIITVLLLRTSSRWVYYENDQR